MSIIYKKHKITGQIHGGDEAFFNAFANDYIDAPQAEIDDKNLASAKQIFSSKVTQTRKAIQGEPIKYGAKQFPTSDKALTNMTGEIALALYAFCQQEFGVKFTNFMKSIPATWTTIDGENVNTNIDDLYAIGNAIRNKTRPLYTNEANVLNEIHNATKVEDVEAIAGTYKPTLPTTTDGSDGLFNTDGAMAGGL